MHSHHSHSGEFCSHASGSLEEAVMQAIAQGFTVFAMTEHMPRYLKEDLYPEEIETQVTPETLSQKFSEYYTKARQLQAKYEGQISLLVGLETEFIHSSDLEQISKLRIRFPVDFCIGSLHHVNCIPIDFSASLWQKASDGFANTTLFFEAYFDQQHILLQNQRPEIVGHLDLILLFCPFQIELMSIQSVAAKITRNIALVNSYGGLFELNSSAFRKGWDTAYPKSDVVKEIQAQGGRFCLSDDSHGPQQIGMNYSRLKLYIQEMQISELWYLGRRENGHIHFKTMPATRFIKWKPQMQ